MRRVARSGAMGPLNNVGFRTMDKTETRGVLRWAGQGRMEPKKEKGKRKKKKKKRKLPHAFYYSYWECYGFSKPLELQGPQVLQD